jgi:hypothetical protein
MTDDFDAVKRIALDASGERFVTLGGDVRLKLVNARDIIIGDDPGSSYNVLLQRYHVHASVQAAESLRFFGEIKSNLEENREPAPRPTDVDRLDVHQLFADIRAGGVVTRIGRQELAYGAGRRIFPRNGPNVRGNFDGVRVITQAGPWSADAFAFRPVEIKPGTFDDDTIDSQTFGGIYATGAPEATWPLALDLYWIDARREGVRFVSVGNESRHTFGVRVAGARGRWDLDGEASYQNGGFSGRRIRAWAVTGETGYAFPGAYPVRVSLRASAASGDRDPADGGLETFNSLFPYGGTLDEFFNLSMANVLFVRPSFEVQVAPSVKARVDLAWTWRTSDRDGVYNPAGNIIRAPGTSRARDVGRDSGIALGWTPTRHLAIAAVTGRYIPGAFLKETATAATGPARNGWIFNVVASYRF